MNICKSCKNKWFDRDIKQCPKCKCDDYIIHEIHNQGNKLFSSIGIVVSCFALVGLLYVIYTSKTNLNNKQEIVVDVVAPDSLPKISVKKDTEEFDDVDSRKIPLSTSLDIYKEKYNKAPDWKPNYGLYIDLQNSNLSKDSLSASFYDARNEGKLNEALAYADRVINLEPDDYHWLEGRSSIYYYLGDSKKALNDINNAIELLNKDKYAFLDFYNNKFLWRKAHIQYMMTSYNDAIQTINSLIELSYWFSHSQKTDVFLLKGKCLNAMGKYDHSCVQFEKTIEISKCDNCKSEQIAKKYLENYCNTRNNQGDGNVLSLILPNVIKPFNDDSQNKALEFPGLETYTLNNEYAVLRVFDKWGTQVYVDYNFTNDKPWYGTNQQNKALSEGTYFYTLYLSLTDEEKQNAITIFRD